MPLHLQAEGSGDGGPGTHCRSGDDDIPRGSEAWGSMRGPRSPAYEPGPQTSRPRGTRCRPQTGYKLRVRAAGGKGQGARSGPAGGPRPRPRSPLRGTDGPLLPPQHGTRTPPSGPPRRLGLGKDRLFRDLGKRAPRRGRSERDTEQGNGLRTAEMERQRRYVRPDRAKEHRWQDKRVRDKQEKEVERME